MNVTNQGMVLFAQTKLGEAIIHNGFIRFMLIATGFAFLAMTLICSLNKDFDYKLIKFKKGVDKEVGTRKLNRLSLFFAITYLFVGILSTTLAESSVSQTFLEVTNDIFRNESKLTMEQNKIVINELENELDKIKNAVIEPVERVVNILSTKGSASEK